MEKQRKPTEKRDRKGNRSNQGAMTRQELPKEGHPEQYAGGPEHRGGDAREDRNP